MLSQQIDIGWVIFKSMRVVLHFPVIIVFLISLTLVSFSTVSSFSIKFYASNIIMNASLLDEWIFEIQHDKEGNESLIWRNSSDKKKVKMNFQNVKDVHSMTLDNAGHCYNLKFSLKREEIETVKDEQVDTLDEYYQEKSSGNHFHPISGGFIVSF
jgi:hypothetical protein